VNRDSGTDRANGGWLRRLVRPKNQCICLCFSKYSRLPSGNAVYPTTIQPSASGVFRTSILVLATVLYCHFVSWLVVQQPARKRLLTAIRSAMVFFIVSFLTPRLAYGFGLTSRAQARGTNQREPRSGTGDAIPRCLQRFVRPHRHHCFLSGDVNASPALFLFSNCSFLTKRPLGIIAEIVKPFVSA
jgi:hypothetical protein